MAETYSVRNHFVNKDPSVRALYDRSVSPLLSSPKKFNKELKTRLQEAYLLSA